MSGFLRLLESGVRLGRWFGVAVYIHLVFIIWIAFDLLGGMAKYGLPGLIWYGITSAFLFGIVLVHEYGHCFAGRAVGGTADRILMWPLGGLAYVSAPYQPTPQLIVAVGGPLVNVGILLLLTPYIVGSSSAEFASYFLGAMPSGEGTIPYYISVFYAINLDLLLFNLIPAFPMDGGRILRSLLWYRMGLERATIITVYVARVAGALMILGGLGLIGVFEQSLILTLIGVFVIFGSEQERRLVQAGAVGYDPYSSFSTGSEPARGSPLGNWWRERRDLRHRKKFERERRKSIEVKQRVDQLLDKVHREGMNSLSPRERRFLTSASRRFKR